MRVSVLLILHRGEDHITIHNDDERAWSELVGFVDARWTSQGMADTSPPISEDDRVRRFFSEEGASYILGSADVSQLEARISTLVPDKPGAKAKCRSNWE